MDHAGRQTKFPAKPPAKNVKRQALEAIAELPETAGLDDIMYRLYVLDKIGKGRQDAKEGRTTSAAQLQREIEQW